MTVPVLLLAAGRSSRMRGRDKLLEILDGVPLLRRQAARAAAAAPVLIVLPQGATGRANTLAGLDLRLVEVPAGVEMSASLAAGAAALPDDASGAIVMLADMPEIDTPDLDALLARHAKRPEAIFRAATEDGAPGNPVLFPRSLFGALQGLTGDTGARDILGSPPVPLEFVPLPGRRAAIDLDTPEDWAAWRDQSD